MERLLLVALLFNGDVWRDGPQLSAPTYGAYAAQAWLASRTSPVNLVRLLGDQHPQASELGYAGWQLTSSLPSSTEANNSTAYGLFVVDKTGKPANLTYNSITVVGNGMSDTQKITVNDGVNAAVVFEFDNDGSVTAGNISITFDSLSNAAIAANIAAAIEAQAAAGNLNVAVSYDSGDNVVKIAVLHTTPGTLTNTAVDVGITSGVLSGADVAPTAGALAAIFYVDSGYMGLVGTDAGGGANNNGAAEKLILSDSDNIGFTIQIYDASQNKKDKISFNFDRNSEDYIRNKFSTNPQQTNSSVTDNDDLLTYWLGESFERHLKTHVTTKTKTNQFGVLLPLQKGNDASDKKSNWSYHRVGSQEAKSGWLIDYHDGTPGDYHPDQMTKLFRFESLHAGEEVQKNILIGIEELKLATNATIYPYGTFTVKIMNTSGLTLEKYTNCNLDPNSPNFIARRIGDMYMEWSENDRRYRSYGDHPNVSDYVRIKMYDEQQNYKSTALPFGFFGPGRPKGFGAIDGDSAMKSLDLTSDFTGSFTKGADSVPLGSGGDAIELGSLEAVKFVWPSIPLRINGSDGFSANPYKVYFGIRPKVDANSSLHDEDYVDYIRMLPSHYRKQAHEVTDSGFEHSFVFSLDDIKVDTDLNTVTYESGSRKAGTSRTATSGALDLLSNDVKQFALPLFGGFDGLDIKQKEPFSESEIGTTLSETTNYVQYSLNKALDSISDPEAVPASLLSIPGVKNTIITDKVIRVAEARKDMLAVIDLENDYTPSFESRKDQQARLGNVNSAISSLKSRAINSSYAAAYYPAVQITDNLNNRERVWVPASVAGIGAMAQSDAASELWFAPAGFNRGGLGNLGGHLVLV